MRSDLQLQNSVIEHLDFDPALDASHIGVAVHAGVVTLSGRVSGLNDKRSAEIAAGQVRGVKAVVDDIAVELPGHCRSADEVVGERAYQRLQSNSQIPLERIQINVQSGVVTVRGEVSFQFQRKAVEEDLARLNCVREVRNEIIIKPPIDALLITTRIRNVLARIAPLDADKIDVSTEGSGIILSGAVNSWHEKGMAESAAWSIPGVTSVANHIQVV